MLAHPKVAFRSCEDCLLHRYDEETGVRLEHPKGSGRPLPRGTGKHRAPAPCEVSSVACPKGSPAAGKELTPQNWAAWRFHQECRAVGRWPDCPIVRQNAAIIDEAERSFDRLENRNLKEMLAAMAGVRKGL